MAAEKKKKLGTNDDAKTDGLKFDYEAALKKYQDNAKDV